MIDAWRSAMPEPNSSVMAEPPALFVYVPYCPSVCTYCDFNVYARREGEFDSYADAVVREVELVAGGVPPPRPAKTLSFGGGTPSHLSAQQLERITNAVTARFVFEPGAEWMLEANPGTVDLDKLRALRGMGFNRLSLGVQTFDDARLRAFNRAHTVADSYEALALARQAGFENINLDLIYGLPDQSLADWQATLEQALALETEHLSLYGLQVEERTVLKQQIALGRVPAPNSDTAAEMYEHSVRRLAEAGYTHYEISNWAKPGFESQHNRTYWLDEPYLGFGAGAHSYWHGERYENVKNPQAYIHKLARGESPIAARETIGRAMEMAEVMFLGLRLGEGVTWARFRERFGKDARVVFEEPIAQLTKWRLLDADEEGMRLTEQGMLVSNQVLWRFLPEG